jgi:hypothetical protein
MLITIGRWLWCTQVWVILRPNPSPTSKVSVHIYIGQTYDLTTRAEPVRNVDAEVERTGVSKKVQLKWNHRTQIDGIPKFHGPWEERELGAVFCQDAIEVRNAYRHATLSSANICERNQPSHRDAVFFLTKGDLKSDPAGDLAVFTFKV